MSSATRWKGGAGDWSDSTLWTNEAPRSGSTVTISGEANVTVRGVYLRRETVNVRGTGANSGLTFKNSTVGYGSTMDVAGQGWLPPLTMIGSDINAGTINVSSGTFGVYVMEGASFINNYNMTAAPSSPSGASQLSLMDNGTFENNGNLIARFRGAQTFWFGGQPTSSFVNHGLIEADAGGVITISAPYLSNGYTGTLTSTGHLVDDGTMTLNSNLNQFNAGHTTVENGGLLNVNGGITGNTVEITSASLQHVSQLNFGLGEPIEPAWALLKLQATLGSAGRYKEPAMFKSTEAGSITHRFP